MSHHRDISPQLHVNRFKKKKNLFHAESQLMHSNVLLNIFYMLVVF